MMRQVINVMSSPRAYTRPRFPKIVQTQNVIANPPPKACRSFCESNQNADRETGQTDLLVGAADLDGGLEGGVGSADLDEGDREAQGGLQQLGHRQEPGEAGRVDELQGTGGK